MIGKLERHSSEACFGEVSAERVVAMSLSKLHQERHRDSLAQLAGDALVTTVGSEHVVSAVVLAKDLLARVHYRDQILRGRADVFEARAHCELRQTPEVLLAVQALLLDRKLNSGRIADDGA